MLLLPKVNKCISDTDKQSFALRLMLYLILSYKGKNLGPTHEDTSSCCICRLCSALCKRYPIRTDSKVWLYTQMTEVLWKIYVALSSQNLLANLMLSMMLLSRQSFVRRENPCRLSIFRMFLYDKRKVVASATTYAAMQSGRG